MLGRGNIVALTQAFSVTVGWAKAVMVSGCVSSCLLFPDRLSRENAGPEEVAAAPPSRDNIAFLPECFRTFQLDSTLRLLSGIVIVPDCLCIIISTWFNEPLFVKLSTARKGHVFQGRAEKLFRALLSKQQTKSTGGKFFTVGANNMSAREIYLWCSGNK